MSRKKEALISIISISIVATIILIAIFIGLFIIGATAQFITQFFDPSTGIFESNPILLGLGIIAAIAAIVSTLILAFGILFGLSESAYKFTKNIVQNVVAPESATCRIFEPCAKD